MRFRPKMSMCHVRRRQPKPIILVNQYQPKNLSKWSRLNNLQRILLQNLSQRFRGSWKIWRQPRQIRWALEIKRCKFNNQFTMRFRPKLNRLKVRSTQPKPIKLLNQYQSKHKSKWSRLNNLQRILLQNLSQRSRGRWKIWRQPRQILWTLEIKRSKFYNQFKMRSGSKLNRLKVKIRQFKPIKLLNQYQSKH